MERRKAGVLYLGRLGQDEWTTDNWTLAGPDGSNVQAVYDSKIAEGESTATAMYAAMAAHKKGLWGCRTSLWPREVYKLPSDHPWATENTPYKVPSLDDLESLRIALANPAFKCHCEACPGFVSRAEAPRIANTHPVEVVGLAYEAFGLENIVQHLQPPINVTAQENLVKATEMGMGMKTTEIGIGATAALTVYRLKQREDHDANKKAADEAVREAREAEQAVRAAAAREEKARQAAAAGTTTIVQQQIVQQTQVINVQQIVQPVMMVTGVDTTGDGQVDTMVPVGQQ